MTSAKLLANSEAIPISVASIITRINGSVPDFLRTSQSANPKYTINSHYFFLYGSQNKHGVKSITTNVHHAISSSHYFTSEVGSKRVLTQHVVKELYIRNTMICNCFSNSWRLWLGHFFLRFYIFKN